MQESNRFRRYEDRMSEAEGLVREELARELPQYFVPILGDFGFVYEYHHDEGASMCLVFRNDERGDGVEIEYDTHTDDFCATHFMIDKRLECLEDGETAMNQKCQFELFVLMLHQWLDKIGVERTVRNPT